VIVMTRNPLRWLIAVVLLVVSNLIPYLVLRDLGGFDAFTSITLGMFVGFIHGLPIAWLAIRE
jgi:hypothetical protein